MRFLVTGGGGYLGSILVPSLLSEGHDVRVLDSGLFGLEHLPVDDIELVHGDLERVVAVGSDRLVEGIDAVVHLAAVSNDPSGDLDPVATHRVNTVVTEKLATAARKVDARFVFASSASIYGDGDDLVDEDGHLHPLSHYAKSKAQAEVALIGLRDETWSPVILRMGTLFGLSPRMRFDLVVNIFGMLMATDRKLKVFGDGMQWRPYIHVQDAARAFLHFAQHEPSHDEPVTFNLSHANHRVVDLVDIATNADQGLEVQFVDSAPDHRSYRVATDRARVAGFQTFNGVDHGLEEVRSAVAAGRVAEPTSPIYRNAAWLSKGVAAPAYG